MKKWTRVLLAQRHTRKIYRLLSLNFEQFFFSSYIRACLKKKMKLNYIDLSAYYKDCKTISGRTETLTRDSRRDAINIVITSFTPDSTSTGETNLSLKNMYWKNVNEKERWCRLSNGFVFKPAMWSSVYLFQESSKLRVQAMFQTISICQGNLQEWLLSDVIEKGKKRYSRRLKWQLL